MDPKDIHSWHQKYIHHKSCEYPKPMVDHQKTAKECIEIFKRTLSTDEAIEENSNTKRKSISQDMKKFLTKKSKK